MVIYFYIRKICLKFSNLKNSLALLFRVIRSLLRYFSISNRFIHQMQLANVVHQKSK